MAFTLAPFSWNTFLRQNRWFLALLLFFLCVGFIWVYTVPKGTLILWFSAHRNPTLDLIFRAGTQGGEVAGFLIALLCLLALRYRWALALPALTIGVTLISNTTKTLFHQPRPARYFEAQGLLDELIPVSGVTLHSGFNSLPSGHTMAGFAFFAFVAFCLPSKRIGAIVMFCAALLVGISRIYLAQHFELDVLLGALLGVGLAMLFYRLFFVDLEAVTTSRLNRNMLLDLKRSRVGI